MPLQRVQRPECGERDRFSGVGRGQEDDEIFCSAETPDLAAPQSLYLLTAFTVEYLSLAATATVAYCTKYLTQYLTRS